MQAKKSYLGLYNLGVDEVVNELIRASNLPNSLLTKYKKRIGEQLSDRLSVDYSGGERRLFSMKQIASLEGEDRNNAIWDSGHWCHQNAVYVTHKEREIKNSLSQDEGAEIVTWYLTHILLEQKDLELLGLQKTNYGTITSGRARAKRIIKRRLLLLATYLSHYNEILTSLANQYDNISAEDASAKANSKTRDHQPWWFKP